MKKVLYLLVTVFVFTLFSSSVYASDFSISLSGDESFSDEIDIDIVVGNLTGFPNNFYGLDAVVSYDKAKIELVSITKANQNYDLTYNSTNDKFVVLTGNGVPAGTTLATMKFRNKALSDGETVTVSLTNMIGSNDNEDVIKSGTVSKTVTYTAADYMLGDMNKNDKIDLQDIIILLKKYLNDDATAEEKQIGDMDRDGNIGLKDIILLLKEYLKV